MGVMATETHLKAVELAENYVRGVLDLDVNGRLNVRVRMLSGGRAVVELDEEVLLRHVRNQDDGDDGGVESILRRDGFESKCIEEWGFQSFGGVRSFKTGSVAAMPITTAANGNDGQLLSMASTASVGI